MQTALVSLSPHLHGFLSATSPPLILVVLDLLVAMGTDVVDRCVDALEPGPTQADTEHSHTQSSTLSQCISN